MELTKLQVHDHPAPPADEVSLTTAASILGRSDESVRRLIGRGKIAARKVLGRVLVKRADLDKLLVGEALGPTPAAG